jgi:hypothetical protein
VELPVGMIAALRKVATQQPLRVLPSMRTTILLIIVALQMTTPSAQANEAQAVAPAEPQTPATPEPGTSSEASETELSSEDIKLAVERLQPSETEKKLVAEASEEEVAACNQRPNTPFCEAVAKVCTGDTPSSCKAWAPKVARGGRGLVEGGLGDQPTGNATVPPELVEELRRCLRENECRTLADFRDQHNERYIDLRIWCTKEARHSVKRQPGVKKICNAIKDFEDDVEDAETAALWELQRALGKIEEAEGRKARADATVIRFKPFQKHIAVAVAGRTSRTQQVGKDEETLQKA